MDKALEDYYKARFEMFSSQGWKDLIEDLDKMIVSTNSIDGVNDEKTLYIRKGELSIMYWLINLESMSNTVFQELKEEK